MEAIAGLNRAPLSPSTLRRRATRAVTGSSDTEYRRGRDTRA